MIILLLLYAITQSDLSEAISTPPSLERRDPITGGCGEPIETRTIWNIIWSCLSTILLCTWASLHPNIKSIQEKPSGAGGGSAKMRLWNRWFGFYTYRLPLFLWALLVPEYILAWAIRQYIMAGMIREKVPGWTRTHGHFLLMGGFQLFERNAQPLRPMNGETDDDDAPHLLEPGTFIRILDIEDVDQHKLDKILPYVTEEEIKDRGKSDGMAKAIVLLQTMWFVVQCAARGLAHLPLTRLEIMTLAYAMMNFFIYIFWWDKPRDVGCPIRVYSSLTTTTGQKKAEQWKAGFGVLERLFVYATGRQDKHSPISRSGPQVPMHKFWNGGLADKADEVTMNAALGPSILGIAFGAIHFIAWSYSFPSYAELLSWRISCIAMVVIPLFSTAVCTWVVTGVTEGLIKSIGIGWDPLTLVNLGSIPDFKTRELAFHPSGDHICCGKKAWSIATKPYKPVPNGELEAILDDTFPAFITFDREAPRGPLISIGKRTFHPLYTPADFKVDVYTIQGGLIALGTADGRVMVLNFTHIFNSKEITALNRICNIRQEAVARTPSQIHEILSSYTQTPEPLPPLPDVSDFDSDISSWSMKTDKAYVTTWRGIYPRPG